MWYHSRILAAVQGGWDLQSAAACCNLPILGQHYNCLVLPAVIYLFLDSILTALFACWVHLVRLYLMMACKRPAVCSLHYLVATQGCCFKFLFAN